MSRNNNSAKNLSDLLFKTVVTSGIGKVGTKRILRGRFTKLLNTVGRALSYSSTRAYGCFFLAFGILTLLLHFGEYYFIDSHEVAISTIIIGISISALSVPLLIFDRPMCIALQDFSITDYIFFEFFAIKRMHRGAVKEHIHPLLFLFLGFIPAIIGFFVPVEWVVLGIFVLIFVTVAFTTPEFPMIFTLLILPYIPYVPYTEVILLSLTVITFLSYLFKVIVGKRVYNFDIYGVLILLLIAFAIVSGALGFGDGAFKTSLIFTVLALGYFPISNLISNRRLAECAVNAIVVSAIPITVLAIIEYVVEHEHTSFVPPPHSTQGTSALFTSPSALAAFMLASLILTLFLVGEEKNKLKATGYSIVFSLEVVVLILTMQPFAWLSAILSSVAYLVIISNRIPTDTVSLLFALVHLVFLIPVSILSVLSDAVGMMPTFAECIVGYGVSVGVFLDNILMGVGMGEESFSIASGGQEKIVNTIIGIGVELGIFALVIFVLIILLRLRHVSHYRRYTASSPMRSIVNMSTLALVALLFFGSYMYIFEDSTVAYLFWSLLGISSSSLTVAKSEYDDRLGYYGDFQSSDSSNVDVTLR